MILPVSIVRKPAAVESGCLFRFERSIDGCPAALADVEEVRASLEALDA